MSMGYWMTICTDPYTPFIDEELESDASGGYWIVVQEKDIPSFTYVGTHGSVIFRLVLKNQHRAGHTALATSPRVLRGAVAPLIAA